MLRGEGDELSGPTREGWTGPGPSTPHRVKFEKKTNGIRGPPHNVRAPLLQVLITTNKNKNYYLFIFISKKLEKKKRKKKKKKIGVGASWGGAFVWCKTN